MKRNNLGKMMMIAVLMAFLLQLIMPANIIADASAEDPSATLLFWDMVPEVIYVFDTSLVDSQYVTPFEIEYMYELFLEDGTIIIFRSTAELVSFLESKGVQLPALEEQRDESAERSVFCMLCGFDTVVIQSWLHIRHFSVLSRFVCNLGFTWENRQCNGYTFVYRQGCFLCNHVISEWSVRRPGCSRIFIVRV